jgi:hypothetical protein
MLGYTARGERSLWATLFKITSHLPVRHLWRREDRLPTLQQGQIQARATACAFASAVGHCPPLGDSTRVPADGKEEGRARAATDSAGSRRLADWGRGLIFPWTRNTTMLPRCPVVLIWASRAISTPHRDYRPDCATSS